MTPRAEPPRLLFFSWHAFPDASSGASLSVRDLLALLTGRGWRCRVLCGPHLDFLTPTPLLPYLRGQGHHPSVRPISGGGAHLAVLRFRVDGIPVTACAGPCEPYQPPAQPTGQLALALLQRLLERERPDVLLTYGGHWLGRAVVAAARRCGVPVAFWLRNLDYPRADLFAEVRAVLVPSDFLRDHYRRTLGLDPVPLPSPITWERVRCAERRPAFVTFVNPTPQKGVFLFARIAHELGRRRPEIPLLVVEGRGGAGWLERTGVDLTAANLHRMANTPDPRDFYRLSRAVLVPSLWPEPSGRVAAEAVGNGIPVLASRRGGLPETLAGAGFVFDVPDRYTPASTEVPTAEEVRPWLETIVRLWDDPAFAEEESRRCLRAAEAWQPERLGAAYDAVLQETIRAGTGPPSAPPGAARPDQALLDELLAEAADLPPPAAATGKPPAHGQVHPWRSRVPQSQSEGRRGPATG